MYAGNTAFDAVNVQATLGQLDLLPLQVADLRGPQTMAVGDQDHGRVAMPVAAMLAGLTVKFTMFGARFLDLDFIGVKRSFSTSSD